MTATPKIPTQHTEQNLQKPAIPKAPHLPAPYIWSPSSSQWWMYSTKTSHSPNISARSRLWLTSFFSEAWLPVLRPLICTGNRRVDIFPLKTPILCSDLNLDLKKKRSLPLTALTLLFQEIQVNPPNLNHKFHGNINLTFFFNKRCFKIRVTQLQLQSGQTSISH